MRGGKVVSSCMTAWKFNLIYPLNKRLHAERGLDESREILDLLARTLRNQMLVDDTGKAVLDLVTRYADTWRLLLEYDEDRLTVPSGAKPATSALDHALAVRAIETFERDLMTRRMWMSGVALA